MAVIIRIKDLRLRAIIGIEEWERASRQDVVLNLAIEFDGSKASQSDDVRDTVNYKTIAKRVIALVEASECFLLEHLADRVARAVLEEAAVRHVRVEIDKPGALRFADSVSVEVSSGR